MTNTSIENITKACGISKGAFYKHFRSKEEMILALLENYYEQLFQPVSEEGSPLEKLEKQIAKEFSQASAYRSFIFELTLTFPPGSDNEVVHYLNEQHRALMIWRKDALLAAFGEKSEQMLEDLLVLTDGMIHGYLHLMIWQNTELPVDILSKFIVESLEAIVQKEGSVTSVLPAASQEPVTLYDLHNEAAELFDQSGNSSFEEGLEMLAEEWLSESPRFIVIDAMLKHMQEQNLLTKELISLRTKWERWKGEQS